VLKTCGGEGGGSLWTGTAFPAFEISKTKIKVISATKRKKSRRML
jgi:hypothetical protein